MPTSLANMINRMNVWTPIYNMDEVRKVNAIDQAIRMFRQRNQPPWVSKKSTMRIFQDVFIYPLAPDHAQLEVLSDPNWNQDFFEQPRYIFTTLKDFIENPSYRNYIADIWVNGTRMLGVRNKTNRGLTSSLMDSAESVSGWSTSGDAGTPVLDRVIFITGNSSIRVPVVNSSNVATISSVFTGFFDSDYQRKYAFFWVYLDGVPTSITLRAGTSGSQYLESTVTTQFAGQPFIADDWNLVAIDLNLATDTGSFAGNFAYQAIILNGAPTGTYYVDASYLRGWALQDYWYYSTYNVLNGSTYQDFFAEDGATYDLSAVLLGETVWHEVILYEADLYLLSDQKESKIYQDVEKLRNEAWANLSGRYPDLSPYPMSETYRFGTEYPAELGWPNDAAYG